jgi:hypothetical protein
LFSLKMLFGQVCENVFGIDWKKTCYQYKLRIKKS